MITPSTIVNHSRPFLVNRGKVRDIYDVGHNLLLIHHSDRASSFDKVWCEIPNKGKILNLSSAFWFERTKHIIDNHMISVPSERDMVVKKCKVFPIEFIVRGYITGTTKTSLWTHYEKGEREYCGLKIPNNLNKNQKLKDIIVTPTTKGESDELISFKEIIDKRLMTLEQLNYCYSKATQLYKYGVKLAKGSGLILVDTKYEFGIDEYTKKIILVDEIHTCDSSRYWKDDTYEARFRSGMEPENFDKDLVRRYVSSQCDPYSTKPSDLVIPENIINTVSKVYAEFYNIIANSNPRFLTDINESVEQSVDTYFESDVSKVICVFMNVEGEDNSLKKNFFLRNKKFYTIIREYKLHQDTPSLMTHIESVNKRIARGQKVINLVLGKGREANHLLSIIHDLTDNIIIVNEMELYVDHPSKHKLLYVPFEETHNIMEKLLN